MMIRSLTLPPSDTDVDAWTAVLAAAQSTDLPDVPAPTRSETAGRLRVRPARARHVCWAADEGVAALLLFTDEGNTHTAFLDVLAVRPEARRRGVGTALWERVRAELLAQDRTSVSAMVDLDGPGRRFAQSLGFENVLPLAWYVRDLPVGTPAPGPAAPAGYELLTWHGLVPDGWAPAAAAAHGAMEDAPSGDMDEQTQSWTAQRLHAAQQLILDRGGEMVTVAAVTAAGEVAAYTEVALADPSGPRALQYDTVVVPGHRGHGLGRVVKLRMEAELAGRYPALRQIATTVADENAPMRAVNEAVGYRRERAAGIFQLKL
ncbi:GNAT family N-acetyltransferase [Streptomyces sp. NPDC091371]|uniref:GNAT family N-acetyltransferase n=1 Tax=Streptomyces sp. NPDC091371 TaxID=3155303 RepID=UPI0034420B87